MVPSMQIHLFDFKSTEPLVNGLAGNRLQLCMLILAKLRETYWSAAVMYRLFERAQRILEESRQSQLRTVPGLTRRPVHETDGQEPQEILRGQVQHQNNYNIAGLDTTSASWPLMSTQVESSSIWDDPLGFDTVDELLGPGFGLPEDAFQGLFPGIGSNDLPLGSQDNAIQSTWFG